VEPLHPVVVDLVLLGLRGKAAHERIGEVSPVVGALHF
jgi:hypothetical protein